MPLQTTAATKHDFRLGFEEPTEEIEVADLPVEGELPGWLAGSPLPTGDEELVEKSRQVLRRAVRSHDNEWWELWHEAGLADDVTASCRRALAWLGDRDD